MWFSIETYTLEISYCFALGIRFFLCDFSYMRSFIESTFSAYMFGDFGYSIFSPSLSRIEVLGLFVDCLHMHGALCQNNDQ